MNTAICQKIDDLEDAMADVQEELVKLNLALERITNELHGVHLEQTQQSEFLSRIHHAFLSQGIDLHKSS